MHSCRKSKYGGRRLYPMSVPGHVWPSAVQDTSFRPGKMLYGIVVSAGVGRPFPATFCGAKEKPGRESLPPVPHSPSPAPADTFRQGFGVLRSGLLPRHRPLPKTKVVITAFLIADGDKTGFRSINYDRLKECRFFLRQCNPYRTYRRLYHSHPCRKQQICQ